MGYEAIRLQRPLAVDDIVSVHYFEYSSNYYFEGERHDFWEFLYVDKGELDVRAGDVVQHLKKGQIIFHKPGEFHALSANGVVAPNLVVVGFVCHGEAMRFFENRVLSVGDSGRALLARIVEEGEAAFSTPLNDPQTMQLARREDAPFGAEQLIGSSIEQLLIGFIRRGADEAAAAAKPTSLIRERTQIFREKTGGGAMEYFGTLKIDAAKRMIREGTHNFTEIAALLGYNSIHYFSRHFKKVTGMTPSEYASSVKILATKNRTE